MAEGVLRHRFPELNVYSAGLNVICGASVNRLAIDVAWTIGIDIHAHRARKISDWMVEEADLVLAMDASLKRAIAVKYPGFQHKIWQLGEFGSFDVPDPYLKGRDAYRRALSLIIRGIDDWSDIFISTNSPQSVVPEHAYAS
jgi:protein-tyrosine phosphatase